ncbi:hypothetical protein MNBD_UNCLBAC01-722 [hydrothermal vent metagenome]|uniref:Membrane transporter protein n=1 Tax=hydrothermal vent metagenome TaxID=652676 RepID=A0A3B1DPL9_9ZZZZ
MAIISYIAVGLLAGIMGGALGIGGGTIMVPLFVILFGLTQHQAQGTALAVMLPPVFIFAVWRYYCAGNVKVQMAIFVAMGLVVGAFLGAHMVQNIPAAQLKKGFGVFLVLVGLKIFFGK